MKLTSIIFIFFLIQEISTKATNQPKTAFDAQKNDNKNEENINNDSNIQTNNKLQPESAGKAPIYKIPKSPKNILPGQSKTKTPTVVSTAKHKTIKPSKTRKKLHNQPSNAKSSNDNKQAGSSSKNQNTQQTKTPEKKISKQSITKTSVSIKPNPALIVKNPSIPDQNKDIKSPYSATGDSDNIENQNNKASNNTPLESDTIRKYNKDDIENEQLMQDKTKADSFPQNQETDVNDLTEQIPDAKPSNTKIQNNKQGLTLGKEFPSPTLTNEAPHESNKNKESPFPPAADIVDKSENKNNQASNKMVTESDKPTATETNRESNKNNSNDDKLTDDKKGTVLAPENQDVQQPEETVNDLSEQSNSNPSVNNAKTDSAAEIQNMQQAQTPKKELSGHPIVTSTSTIKPHPPLTTETPVIQESNNKNIESPPPLTDIEDKHENQNSEANTKMVQESDGTIDTNENSQSNKNNPKGEQKELSGQPIATSTASMKPRPELTTESPSAQEPNKNAKSPFHVAAETVDKHENQNNKGINKIVSESEVTTGINIESNKENTENERLKEGKQEEPREKAMIDKPQKSKRTPFALTIFLAFLTTAVLFGVIVLYTKRTVSNNRRYGQHDILPSVDEEEEELSLFSRTTTGYNMDALQYLSWGNVAKLK